MAFGENGIVIIDKPGGRSSASVLAEVKQLYRAKKAGHAGTLDPMATGILICCLNRATRLARFFLGGGKRYRAVLQLGVETDTQDATGETVKVNRVPAFSRKAIESTLAQFIGTIMQQPPAFSALKHKGVPLYKHARRGKPIQKAPRSVIISEIALERIELPEIAFDVSCSGGTYIRTLCADIGDALGCGGHLKALRRTESEGFTLADAVTLTELHALHQAGKHEEPIVPMAQALHMMPVYCADSGLASRIRKGIRLTASDMPSVDTHGRGYIKVIDENGALLAIVQPVPSERYYRYCGVFR